MKPASLATWFQVGVDASSTLKVRLNADGVVVMSELSAVRFMPPVGQIIELTGSDVDAPGSASRWPRLRVFPAKMCSGFASGIAARTDA